MEISAPSSHQKIEDPGSEERPIFFSSLPSSSTLHPESPVITTSSPATNTPTNNSSNDNSANPHPQPHQHQPPPQQKQKQQQQQQQQQQPIYTFSIIPHHITLLLVLHATLFKLCILIFAICVWIMIMTSTLTNFSGGFSGGGGGETSQQLRKRIQFYITTILSVLAGYFWLVLLTSSIRQFRWIKSQRLNIMTGIQNDDGSSSKEKRTGLSVIKHGNKDFIIMTEIEDDDPITGVKGQETTNSTFDLMDHNDRIYPDLHKIYNPSLNKYWKFWIGVKVVYWVVWMVLGCLVLMSILHERNNNGSENAFSIIELVAGCILSVCVLLVGVLTGVESGWEWKRRSLEYRKTELKLEYRKQQLEQQQRLEQEQQQQQHRHRQQQQQQQQQYQYLQQQQQQLYQHHQQHHYQQQQQQQHFQQLQSHPSFQVPQQQLLLQPQRSMAPSPELTTQVQGILPELPSNLFQPATTTHYHDRDLNSISHSNLYPPRGPQQIPMSSSSSRQQSINQSDLNEENFPGVTSDLLSGYIHPLPPSNPHANMPEH